MISKYLRFSPFYFFCLYSILYVLFTFLFNYILLDDALFYRSFNETLGIDQITKLINRQKFFQMIGYGIIPIFLLLRTFFTAICLVIGIFITEQNLKFNQCFNIALNPIISQDATIMKLFSFE